MDKKQPKEHSFNYHNMLQAVKPIALKLKTFVLKQLKLAFDLHEGTDAPGTIARISDGIGIRGTNSWILICSAMIAAIGLDMDSSALVIGAMLISPLMAPILGIGLGYGISDQKLLMKSLRNFLLAILITLVVSTFYFMLTPLGELTSGLLARTKPTLLDVLVAVFGGVAGIVANSRKELSTAIPGVAIATALMPPLCTAGYGLAKGEWQVLFGAGYLFFINAVFIALSTYLMVRFLRFPFKNFVDAASKKRTQISITVAAIIIIIPSGFIFWDVITETKFKKEMNSFMTSVSTPKYDAIDWELIETDSIPTIKIFVIGEQMESATINNLDSVFKSTVLANAYLQFVQMNLSKEERSSLRDEVMDVVSKNVLKQVSATKEIIDTKDIKIDSLISAIRKMHYKKDDIAEIEMVIKTYQPEIDKIYFGKMSDNSKMDSAGGYFDFNIPTAMVKFHKKTRIRTKNKSKKQLGSFLKTMFHTDSVLVMEI